MKMSPGMKIKWLVRQMNGVLLGGARLPKDSVVGCPVSGPHFRLPPSPAASDGSALPSLRGEFSRSGIAGRLPGDFRKDRRRAGGGNRENPPRCRKPTSIDPRGGARDRVGTKLASPASGTAPEISPRKFHLSRRRTFPKRIRN